MKVIHKFRLASESGETKLKLKLGYKIVHSEYVLVDKAVCIWVEQTLAVEVPEVEVTFQVAKSGEPLQEHMLHVATAVDNFAPEAYHIFREDKQVLGATELGLLVRRPNAA